MAVSYSTACKLLRKFDVVWEHTEPTSQTKTAISGVLVKVVHSRVANTKTLELTILGMDNQQYVWDGSQCRVIKEGSNRTGIHTPPTEEEEDAATGSSESSS